MGMSTKVLLCIHPSIGVLIQLRLTGIDRCQTWVVSYYLFLMAEIFKVRSCSLYKGGGANDYYAVCS